MQRFQYSLMMGLMLEASRFRDDIFENQLSMLLQQGGEVARNIQMVEALLLLLSQEAADMMHTGWNRACAPGLASCYRELFHTTHRAQDSILEGEGRGGERPSWDLITVSEAIPDHPAPAKLSQEQSSPSNLQVLGREHCFLSLYIWGGFLNSTS